MSDGAKLEMRDVVRRGYAEIAESGQWSGVSADPEGGCCGGGGCCGPVSLTAGDVARAVGYGERELESVPAGANMGLSCGNPTAIASLSEGETVVDLGCGGGFDCFIAGPKVGANGLVIGVDMTPEMLSKARGNVASYRAQSGLENVEFRLGEIEHLPVGDASVDVVISNCVLNLSTDQARVWQEIVRVLRPGGRVSVSDLALRQPLPEAIARDVEALVGCVAGAKLIEEIREMAEGAGLTGVRIEEKPSYVETMAREGDPLYEKIRRGLPEKAGIGAYVTSVDISGRRPG